MAYFDQFIIFRLFEIVLLGFLHVRFEVMFMWWPFDYFATRIVEKKPEKGLNSQRSIQLQQPHSKTKSTQPFNRNVVV